MLFTQIDFIFIFLPITLVGYFLLARRFPQPAIPLLWMVGASFVFYACWKISFLPVLLISIAFNFILGQVIARQSDLTRRKWSLAIAVTANLLALAFYKYTNFGLQTFGQLLGIKFPVLNIVLPLGISFFTFTQIAYLVDVYSGYKSERSLIKYSLFVTYFPHLIAGPILHHSEMMPQFGTDESRRFSTARMAIGLTIFAIGLFKKAIIADGFSLLATPVFQAANAGAVWTFDAWGGALAYSLQIYFDFSGYCDMAIGLSYMFGIVLPFNFDSPYKSQSIVEFWRRWHITLSRFLRDYLYIPLGGNRHGAVRRNANLAATMLLGGLWHGAGWTFVIWGGLHGVYLVINHYWVEAVKRSPVLTRLSRGMSYAIASLILTQFVVVLAWVFFRADGIAAARHILQAMFGFGRAPAAGTAPIINGQQMGLVALGYLICVALPNVNAMFDKYAVGLKTYDTPRPWSIVNFQWEPHPAWAAVAGLALVSGIFVSAVVGEGSPFLYFQF